MARSSRSSSFLALAAAACALASFAGLGFVGVARGAPRAQVTGLSADPSSVVAGKPKQFYDDRDPVPKGYVAIRTGLSDLLKPLNSEYGVTAKEDSIPTYSVMVFGIVMLFLFFFLLLLINNQSVLLPPEDEFDEYVANFLPYFFFGER